MLSVSESIAASVNTSSMVLENVPFDLPELMHEITDVLEKQAEERGIEIGRAHV